MNEIDIKQQLLGLPNIEIQERKKIRADYYFYKGKSPDKEKAKQDKALLGQNWLVEDNVDYTPSQDIRNKIKPLLKKQARFMFGKEPTIILKPNDVKDKEVCEELRKFIDDVLENNKFWRNTRKAFLMVTIKKRVILRVEANPKQSIKIKYEQIEDCYYKEVDDKLVQVKFFEADRNNVFAESEEEKLYHIHTYYYKSLEENKPVTAWYKKETFKGNDLEKPIEVIDTETGFDTLPCWLIKNGGEINDIFGESDIEDLKDTQNQYNRRISDFADALRFQMFGAESIIDGDENDVNKLNIAPGALHAIKTRSDLDDTGKQALHQRLEYNFGSSEAINSFLDRAAEDMNFALDMPSIKDLSNIPSAKAMKYLYNDLIARCEEKWTDWQPVFIDLINFIIEVSKYCYGSMFKEQWKSLKYTINFTHNYPIPSDEEDKKKIALEEVKTNVRSHRSYIKDFLNDEDSEGAFNEVAEDIQIINAAEQDQFTSGANNDLNNVDDNTDGAS